MAKLSLIEQLDEVVEAMMGNPDATLPAVDPRVAEVLRIVGQLRDLPRPEFKAHLGAELLSDTNDTREPVRATPSLFEPSMVAHHLQTALSGLRELTPRNLASLNQCALSLFRFSGQSPWERHPAGDELFYVLDGEVDVTVLADEEPVDVTVSAGSLFICPRGLWHRQRARPTVTQLYALPLEGTEHSWAEDPRSEGQTTSTDQGLASATDSGESAIVAHDVRAALASVPELAITSSTTAEEAEAAFRHLAWFNQFRLGVVRFSGLTPWERHPDGDELLYALEGEVDVTVLTDQGPVQTTVRAGSVFICPQGLWHRQLPRPAVAMLFGTPTATPEVSFAEDPRRC